MVGNQIKMFIDRKTSHQTIKTAIIASHILWLYDSIIKMLYLQAENF